MTGALVILLFTMAVGAILYFNDRRRHPRSEAEDREDFRTHEDANDAENRGTAKSSGNSECCGLHLVCEKELTAVAKDEIPYYDDEELDRFAGREPGSYTAEETEEFRDILMTMLPEDVPGWARSLDRRNIFPPQEIRDELLILLRELADTLPSSRT